MKSPVRRYPFQQSATQHKPVPSTSSPLPLQTSTPERTATSSPFFDLRKLSIFPPSKTPSEASERSISPASQHEERSHRQEQLLSQRIQAARGRGQLLQQPVQEKLESSLKADLSSVRVHTDAEADHIARSLYAKAFTTGSDIFFRQGAYRPQSQQGLRLLAHEAAHTLQQQTGLPQEGSSSSVLSIHPPDDRFERSAEQAASRLTQSEGSASQSGAFPSKASEGNRDSAGSSPFRATHSGSRAAGTLAIQRYIEFRWNGHAWAPYENGQQPFGHYIGADGHFYKFEPKQFKEGTQYYQSFQDYYNSYSSSSFQQASTHQETTPSSYQQTDSLPAYQETTTSQQSTSLPLSQQTTDIPSSEKTTTSQQQMITPSHYTTSPSPSYLTPPPGYFSGTDTYSSTYSAPHSMSQQPPTSGRGQDFTISPSPTAYPSYGSGRGSGHPPASQGGYGQYNPYAYYPSPSYGQGFTGYGRGSGYPPAISTHSTSSYDQSASYDPYAQQSYEQPYAYPTREKSDPPKKSRKKKKQKEEGSSEASYGEQSRPKRKLEEEESSRKASRNERGRGSRGKGGERGSDRGEEELERRGRGRGDFGRRGRGDRGGRGGERGGRGRGRGGMGRGNATQPWEQAPEAWLGQIWSPGKAGDGLANAILHWKKHPNVGGKHHAATEFDSDEAVTQATVSYVRHAVRFKEMFAASKFSQKNFAGDGEDASNVDIYFDFDETSDDATILVVDSATGAIRSFYDLNPHIHGAKTNKQWLKAYGANV